MLVSHMQLCSGLYNQDDFLFIGSPDSYQCSSSLSIALVALHMINSMSTFLTFLGVRIDTVACQLRLANMGACRPEHTRVLF